MSPKEEELLLLRRVAKATYDMEFTHLVTDDVHEAVKALHLFLHKHPEVLR